MKKRTVIFIILILLVIIALLAQAFLTYHEAKQLKSNASSVITCIKSNDAEGLSQSCENITSSAKKLEVLFSMPQWWVLERMPNVGDDVASIKLLVEVLNNVCSDHMDEIVSTLKSYPLDNLKTGDGFNATALSAYANLFCNMVPVFEEYEYELSNLSFNVLDKTSYVSKLESITSRFSEISDLIDYAYILRDFVGNGEDKFYLFMAQNAAETRASGGFPGSVGTIEIKDGVLTIGEFKPTNDVLPRNNSSQYTSTYEEFQLFSYWVQYPRDMCYNPNFERVAYVIAKNYELANDKRVDGVLAMTPVIIEDLLRQLGSITLSNGTVIDGENATRFLQRDIYFDYLYLDEGDNSYYNLELTDKLFSETASTTLKAFFSNIKATDLFNYIDIFKKGVEDRVIVMWFQDETTEQLVRNVDASGGLTTDKNEPKVGVYFSCSDPCKLGWFLSIDTVIGDPVDNDDGTKTYDVTVYLNNLLTRKERQSAGTYILGKHNGAIVGNLHVFAPTGGTISDLKASSGYFKTGEYEGLKCYYSQGIKIEASNTIEISFKVTTAWGVATPLGVMHTPTINNN